MTETAGPKVIEATDESFERDVLERSHELPVVVDFWAAWCRPCLALAPVLEQAVAERNGAVALVKVDVDANQGLAGRFGIRGIPAVKAFRNGRPVSEFTGALPPQAVADFLDALTAPPAGERLAEELGSRPGYEEAADALRSGDYESTFELLLLRLESDPAERDFVRETMVGLFADLGTDDELASRFRRRLASSLY